MNKPNLKTCTIAEMISFATQMNGKTRSKKLQSLIHGVLNRLQDYEKIGGLRWSQRIPALRALNDIQIIGVSETLELHNHRACAIQSSLARICDVARCLGLHVNKINGRIIITRTPLTVASKVTMVADLPPGERGNSSPELPL